MLPALLANENVPKGMMVRLRELGFDLLSVSEAQPRMSDRAVLALARDTGRWIVTFDRDYGELIFKYGAAPPPAILFLRQRPRTVHLNRSFSAKRFRQYWNTLLATSMT